MTQRIEPPSSDDTAAYWDATREQRLVIPWCTDCDRAVWYPRLVCPRCLGDALELREASGTGSVHAVSVQHRPGPGRDPEAGPYAVALVDLPEGVRMMTNIVGCDPVDVTVGMSVALAWEPLSDGRHLPVFEPRATD